MFNNINESPLYKILNPRSIAVWGASNNITSMGTSQLLSLTTFGFDGRIYPVHPKEEQVQGLRAYKNVFDLPEVPDLGLIVLPTNVVSHVLEECGQKGLKNAIIVSGGFKEVGGDGVELEKEIENTAWKYQKPIIGFSFRTRDDLFIKTLQNSGIPGFAQSHTGGKGNGCISKVCPDSGLFPGQ